MPRLEQDVQKSDGIIPKKRSLEYKLIFIMEKKSKKLKKLKD